MTKRTLILIFIIFNLTSSGINQYAYINKKTNQFIRFSKSSGHRWTFSLVTKKDSCILTDIIISSDHVDIFIDSLKTLGFKKWKKDKEVTRDYRLKLSIDSCYYLKTIDGDSLFKFVYKYEVKYKNNPAFKHWQTEFVTEKQKVIEGINNKSFSFRAYKITGTTIIHVTIVSFDIYNANKKAIFQSGTAYGFFL